MSPIVLLFDLLESLLSPSLITGIVINKVESIHRITDLPSWIATIIKTINKDSWVFAMSNHPEDLAKRGRLQQIMRCLYLEELSLWPSFRYEVKNEL